MFIGETRAGKSHAARDLLDAEGLPVVVVNDATADPLRPNYRRISWAEVLGVSHCNVLVEDLINCTDAEVGVLKRILNYNAHHRVLPTVILVAHASTRTGAFTTLQHLTHVCFMSRRTSAASLAHVLEHYKYSKAETRSKVEAFLGGDLVEHGYWVLDVNSGNFERKPGSLARPTCSAASVVPGPGGPPGGGVAGSRQRREQSLVEYRKTAEMYLNLFSPESKKALAILDFVLAKAPLQSLSPADLNFTLRDAKTGSVVSVSLLDYLHTLTTQTKPTRLVLDLHAYLSRHVTLPRCFIANAHPRLAR